MAGISDPIQEISNSIIVPSDIYRVRKGTTIHKVIDLDSNQVRDPDIHNVLNNRTEEHLLDVYTGYILARN